ERVSDLDVLPLEAGSTQVIVEAPTLSEAAPERFSQTDLDLALSPDATSIDLLEESLGDALAGNASSDRFDAGLLKTFGAFSRLWRYQIEGFEFDGSRKVRMDAGATARLETLQRQIPPDQRTMVVGKVDRLHHSKRMFTIRTDDGRDLRGFLTNEDVALESLGQLFGQRARVSGVAKFRPSGDLLLIEAEAISADEGGLSVLSVVPKPLLAALDLRGLHRPQGPKSGVGAVF